MPDIMLYDPVLVAKTLGENAPSPILNEDADLETVVARSPAFVVRTPDTDRDQALRTIADDPRGPMRSLAVADHDVLVAIDALARDAPNLAEPIGVVRRAAMLSWATHAPIAVPPILMLGPPGVGKTRTARLIAQALRVPYAELCMASADDPSALVGHSLSWRGARMGRLASPLLNNEARSGSPVFVLDEIDKANAHHAMEQPLAFLHNLLEPENAKVFEDEFLGVPIRADHVLWVMTANDVGRIPPSLLDRMLVLTVAAPTPEQQARIATALYRGLIANQLDPFQPDLDDAVLHALGHIPPRQAKRVLQLALGFAVAKGRRRLAAEDVHAAGHLASRESSCTRPIGFMTGS